MKLILVIEADEQMRENIAEMLEMTGYQVEVALDGLEGIQKVFSLLPDLVISDVEIPGMSGYEVYESMRLSPKSCDIPFILLTPSNDGEQIVHGISLGENDFVTKPFDYTHLVDAVDRHLHPRQIALKNAS